MSVSANNVVVTYARQNEDRRVTITAPASDANMALIGSARERADASLLTRIMPNAESAGVFVGNAEGVLRNILSGDTLLESRVDSGVLTFTVQAASDNRVLNGYIDRATQSSAAGTGLSSSAAAPLEVDREEVASSAAAGSSN